MSYPTGNTLKFKRGSTFVETLYINDSGVEDSNIVLTDYGDENLPSPVFTNSLFDPGQKDYGTMVS